MTTVAVARSIGGGQIQVKVMNVDVEYKTTQDHPLDPPTSLSSAMAIIDDPLKMIDGHPFSPPLA